MIEPRLQITPRATLPEDQRQLLAALGRFLRDHTDTMIPASQRRDRGPAAFLLYAIFIRTVQLGRALQELCIDGHASEALLIGRAMVSATLSILLLAEADSDSRALLFALFQRAIRRQRAKALIKHGHMSQRWADEDDARQVGDEDASLAAQAAAGTVPAARLGTARTTWSGLSDYALAARFNKDGWYDLFYGPMSDISHVNVAAITAEVEAIRAGNVTIGGRFTNPFIPIIAAAETVSHAAEAVDLYFELDLQDARQAADQAMKVAIETYVRTNATAPGA